MDSLEEENKVSVLQLMEDQEKNIVLPTPQRDNKLSTWHKYNLSKGEETEVYQELREKCKRNIGGFVNINILVRNVEILWLDLSRLLASVLLILRYYRPCVEQLLVPSLSRCTINLLHESFLSIAYLAIIHKLLKPAMFSTGTG
ncbi:hypothetical protein ACJX0J_042347 [Zea mays]